MPGFSPRLSELCIATTIFPVGRQLELLVLGVGCEFRSTTKGTTKGVRLLFRECSLTPFRLRFVVNYLALVYNAYGVSGFIAPSTQGVPLRDDPGL